MCDENTYLLSRCRRGDWYILLHNVGKSGQQHVVSTPPSWRLPVIVDFDCCVCVVVGWWHQASWLVVILLILPVWPFVDCSRENCNCFSSEIRQQHSRWQPAKGVKLKIRGRKLRSGTQWQGAFKQTGVKQEQYECRVLWHLNLCSFLADCTCVCVVLRMNTLCFPAHN